MSLINNFMMFHMAVDDMPKVRDFYVDKLGLTVTKDYRMDDANWWVSLAFPGGGTSINMTTAHENLQPGTMKMYFATADAAEAHKELAAKDVAVEELKDDLYGPGSGVKWFKVTDPEGNQILVVQA